MVNLIPGLETGGLSHLLESLSITLLVGFVEEGFYRGLMRALAPRGAWRAVITAVLFGLTHLMNLAVGRTALEQGAQVLYAFAFGFGWAALALRKGILWPLVISHFLIDFANFLQRPGFVFSTDAVVATTLAMTLIFVGYGLFLMRQHVDRVNI